MHSIFLRKAIPSHSHSAAKWLLAILCAGGILAQPTVAQTADYPARTIELVVPYQAGGGADVMARAFAQAMVDHLPQSIVVLNKPGASGVIGWSDVMRARPDGYKVALTTVELTFLKDLGLSKYTHNDLKTIARLNADPAVVVVNADSPYKTLDDLLAAARKSEESIRFGNAGFGSMWHLASAALADKAGVKFNHIPYTGGAPAVMALLGGHIDAVTVSTPEVASFVQAGKLRPLAVMADKRSKGFEQVPTAKELGIDLELGTWRGLAVPLDTPQEVVDILKAATAKAMQEPALRQAMEKQNFTTDTYLDDVAFQESMDRESAYIGPLASKLNINK